MNLLNYLNTEITEGKHRLRVTAVQEKASENGPHHNIRITMEASHGAVMFNNFALTERGKRFLAIFCNVCGLKEEEIANFQIEALVGKTFLGEVGYNQHGYLSFQKWHHAPSTDTTN